MTISGVKVGGKSPLAAEQVLKQALAAKAATPVVVEYKGKKWAIESDSIGLAFDTSSLIDDAVQVGRRDGVWQSAGERIHAWLGGVDVQAIGHADAKKLDAAVSKIASGVDVAPQDAAVTIKDGKATLKPSSAGLALKRPVLESALMRAYTASSSPLSAPVTLVHPTVSDSAAERGQKIAEAMMSAPAFITYQTKTWKVSPESIGDMISFRVIAAPKGAGASAGAAYEPVIAAENTSATLAGKLTGVSLGRAPQDARFKTSGGSVTIVPSREGVGPDFAQLALDLTKALKDTTPAGRTVVLHPTVAQPSLTTERARAMNIHERISTFTTTYSSSASSRVNNIHVLGNALDGKLVAPGATFSFNGAVGERTAAKGYQEANAIVKGKLVPQLGGGICQVATTMFNSVFFSGLPITQRENHSFYISHYPTGRDATVSWGGPDLRWKNTTPDWVLVSVSYTSDSITISLYGTDPGYAVTYETGPFTNVKPYSTQTVSDPTMPVGSKTVTDPGVDGRKVVVTRTVKKDGTLVRTDTFTSNYTPKVEVVNVGSKPAKASNAASATVSPKKR